MSETVQAPAVQAAPAQPEPNAFSVSPPAQEQFQPAPSPWVAPSQVLPSECGCKAAATATAGPQMVFALGQLGHDFTSEARLDSIAQKMAGVANGRNGNGRNGGNGNGRLTPDRSLAYSREHVLAHLENGNFTDASSFEWTLNLDGTTIYAIRPVGPFAAETYKELRDALKHQHVHHLSGDEIARVSIPGVLAGNTRLLNGQTVPVIIPEPRGMFQWTTRHLLEELEADGPLSEAHKTLLLNFLDRVYHELKNLGMTSQDRALNYAATNVHEMVQICKDVLESKERMDLDSIQLTRSSICRPGSDCWDISVYFFYPDRPVQTVRKVYSYAVDVSDVVPVTVGRMRSWFTR
jgi:cyanobactin maturation PatA/PatG family protease